MGRAHRRRSRSPRRTASAGRSPGRQLPPGARRRRPVGAARLCPFRERDAARPRRFPQVPARRLAHRTRHRSHHHPAVRSDRRSCGDTRPGRPRTHSQPPPWRSQPSPAHPRFPRRRLRASPADRAADQPARHPQPAERPPSVPARRGGGGAHRRPLAGTGGGHRRGAARQLFLHPAPLRVHHRRPEQRAGHRSVRGGGGHGLRRGRPGRQTHSPSRPGQRRGHHPRHPGRHRAPRRRTRHGPARPGP